MSENKNINSPLEKDQVEVDSDLAVSRSDVASVTGRSSTTATKLTTTAERQIKFERAQKCLENAALVSKKIKEHRKATAELLGRPFEDDNADTQSELASAMSEKTGYSVATDTSTTLSVQDALNSISESLANTLKQKEILMERIKQYKEISKRPMKTSVVKKDLALESTELRKSSDPTEVSKLLNLVKDKENALSVMQVKLRAMETTILDLQEKINEKDQIIEAKNKATTLISDSLTKKEKDTLHLLEDTKEQMAKMQQNFVTMESEWKHEKQKLLQEIEDKNEKLKSLSEANSILENSRFEISVAHSKLSEELDLKIKEVEELQEQIRKLNETQNESNITPQETVEEKGSKEIADMEELTKKIELLEQINYQIRQTNKELESQLSSASSEPKASTTLGSSPNKKGSPLPTRKGGRNSSAKMKSPWSRLSAESLNQDTDKKPGKVDSGKSDIILQALNKDILEKEYTISQKEAIIMSLQTENKQKDDVINELKLQVTSQTSQNIEKVDVGIYTEKMEKDTEPISESVNVSQDVHEIENKLKLAQDQIALLNEEIDAANKNMIKVKSSSKLKLKQMQKTIENFSKVSDTNAEIVRLNEEIHQLSQKVAELEEEKGNLQLHLVDYDSGRLTDTEVYKKMVEMENLAEARLKSISLLETQKFDLVQELHDLQQKNAEMEDKLADITQLQNEQVCSEMKSVQLEEQIDELIASKKELELVIDNIKLDKEQLDGNIKILQSEKEELLQKLENYIQENMELTDKLEKLSAEKVSSAESIEIVDSLTTQEKLEIEEYNKGIEREKHDDNKTDEISTSRQNITVDKVLQESAELKNRIELFTQERQEVMEKMNTICTENTLLQKKIEDLENECQDLKININILNNEKSEIQSLNEELSSQIEELKRERIEIIKETADIAKPLSNEDAVDSPLAESHHDDKAASEKGGKGTKSVKQLTKEILKLKNIIKEREDEIADCQMKILSLEEQHQKHSELTQSNTSYENKIKQLSEENKNLKLQIDSVTNDKSEQQQIQLKDTIETLRQEMQKVQGEYSVAITNRDAKIQELEHMLMEYEKQVFNYGKTLQQKDKEINEYINQITKLNDISQKLKSRMEILEDEKAKDQNAELVKSLNKQIALYQNALADCEEKLRMLEEEKAQLSSLKSKLENKNIMIETELTNLKQTLNEKQKIFEELQSQQQKQKEEYLEIMAQSKERDEEIHEIKLQLRKESIENEKLRTAIQEKEAEIFEITKRYDEVKQKLNSINDDQTSQNDQVLALESKNKELMEKLKKFALTIKKKSAMYSELENQHNELQKQLEGKIEQYEQALIQVETIPALQEKIKYANEELNSRQSDKNLLDKKCQEALSEIASLQRRYEEAHNEILNLNEKNNVLNKDLYLVREENVNLKTNLEGLNNKLVEYEIELKNNSNLLTKISCLETDINQKQLQISDLINQLQNQEQNVNQLQFGHEAKVQERDMYIETLQIEIEKYKNRICRLEESISEMENRRQSLERKADQLDIQLQDKRKSYSEYTSQEDELVSRLAVLMDHDRVLEKQVHEIENDNKELQYKVQYLNDELQKIHKLYSDLQLHCSDIETKAVKTETLEAENMTHRAKIESLENILKKLSNEHGSILAQRKVEIDEIESEFNTQIEEAIKEKKVLSEKCEKLNDLVSKLEFEKQGYKTTIENLHINLEELTTQNMRLTEKPETGSPAIPDYTEQYVSEINKLNAVLNNKNEQISEHQNKLQTLQAQQLSLKSSLEEKIRELSTNLGQTLQRLAEINAENEKLKNDNEEFANLLCQKEEQIKQLMEKKKVVFEMNIPKTEGMTISSTIEEMSDEQKSTIDMSSLQSQILSDAEISNQQVETVVKKEFQHSEKPTQLHHSSESSIEPLIVPKKAYMCSQTDDNERKVEDPFNSEEGWGLEESVDTYDVTPGTSKLNQEIQCLKEANEKLKKDLDASNAKLLKALKKLKELKSANDMLANELKISKQISNSSLLDMAIESELSNNLEILEKKVQELNDTLTKEKKEKEALTKQNDVLKNANERLIEMKEKLDNEVELWKYNFKQANDKISLKQECVENKDKYVAESTLSMKNDFQFEEEITKLEKENEELQSLVDNLTRTNKELSEDNLNFKNEIRMLQEKCISLENNETVQVELEDLKTKNIDLSGNCEKMHISILALEKQCGELIENSKKEKTEYESTVKQLERDNEDLLGENSALQEEIKLLKIEKDDISNQIASLKSNLDNANLQLQQSHEMMDRIQDVKTLTENYEAVQSECESFKQQLDNANKTIQALELENRTVLQNAEKHQGVINELELKIQKLNSENDQLLSTVTELRSSISSAMDQRGFEIAELWKQHLAQRENEFQQIEQDLRSELSASEIKYEQLLNNVQSSTQEETNKIITMEQVSFLQNKLQEKEDQYATLQHKYEDVMNKLDILRAEMEDEKFNKEQEDYEKIIKELRDEIQKHSEEHQSLVAVNLELVATKTVNDSLNQRIEELNKEFEYKISDLTKQIKQKESEIFQKTHDYTVMLSDRNTEFENVRKQLVEYEKKVEDLSYEKESELAVLRLKMHENSEHYEKMRQGLEEDKAKILEALNAKIDECTNLNKQINDLNKILEEYANKAAETQLVLESQEIEIVTLKDEIESMKNVMRTASTKIEKHVTFASDTKENPGNAAEGTLNKELLDAVPRAELDLALYMLHQRDVRCEELTMELTQLLEERDTLQLRLSDSLRSYEELKTRYGSVGLDISSGSSQDTISELPSFSIEKESQFVDTHRAQSSRSSSISEMDGEKPKLQAKLSELRSVKHSRDVRLRHESEQRQMGMRLLQRDVANLPAEAVDQLNQAHHTLSRDSQSTPTVLLNWLRGKSTPRVVHM